MLSAGRPVRVEEIEYRRLLPWLRFWRCFRIAIHPRQLAVAMLLVICLFLLALCLDLAFGREAAPSDIRRYANPATRTDASQVIETSADDVALAEAGRRMGVFQSVIVHKQTSLAGLANAALRGDWRLDDILTPAPDADLRSSVGGNVRMLMVTPCWMLHTHPAPTLVYLVLFLVIWSFFGGALARMSGLNAARGRHIGFKESFDYASNHWTAFLIAPLIPILIAVVLAAIPLLLGLLMRVAVLDVVAALLIPVALLAGVVITYMLVLLAGAVHLIYPAIAIDGSDVFDAGSRSFHYVRSRPWRLFTYAFIALIYGLVTFLFVSLLVFVTLYVTRYVMLVGGGADAQNILPRIAFAQPVLPTPPDHLQSATHVVAFWISAAFFMLVGALVWAYAISYYFAATTQLYLLLRRSRDQTAYTEVEETGRTSASLLEVDDDLAGDDSTSDAAADDEDNAAKLDDADNAEKPDN